MVRFMLQQTVRSLKRQALISNKINYLRSVKAAEIFYLYNSDVSGNP